MKALRYVYVGATLLAFVLALGFWQSSSNEVAADDNGAPKYRVDPSWPKPLPNDWLVGQVPGIAVDLHDNIWIVQRPRTLDSNERGLSDFNPPPSPNPTEALDGPPRPQGSIARCCLPAPSIIQYDKKGNMLQAWGGPDSPQEAAVEAATRDVPGWISNEHGVYVDHNMNVYTFGFDHRVLKFSADGTFLLQIGTKGRNTQAEPPLSFGNGSNDTGNCFGGTPCLGFPADGEVDPETNELYIADGYMNHRVLVVNAHTGQYIRHWGAYGQNPVNDAGSNAMGPYIKNQAPAPHFRNPVHCVRIVKVKGEKLVYVCDRVNDRIQVFTPDGTFVDEYFIQTDTLGPGSTWDLDTSRDRRQKFLFNADGSNQHIWTLLRATGAILGTFGRNGRHAGDFHWVHNLALDSEGTMYTAEVQDGKRVQKFVLVDDDDDDDDDDD